MNKNEMKRLNVMSKVQYILTVVVSCKTKEQTEISKKWGLEAINRIYKTTYGDKSFYVGTIPNRLYVSDFNRIKNY